MGRDQILDYLGSCESRLLESRRSIQEALDQLQEIRSLLTEQSPDAQSPTREPALRQEQKQEIVEAVLEALGSSDVARQDLFMLVRQDSEGTYRIGRRRLNLTETETQIMDLFWHAAPNPVSRKEIHASLYLEEEDKPGEGVIDVFLSKLRQKLKLASNGSEFLESVRGRGWGLRLDYCEKAEQP